jgi:hypothetical protein
MRMAIAPSLKASSRFVHARLAWIIKKGEGRTKIRARGDVGKNEYFWGRDL